MRPILAFLLLIAGCGDDAMTPLDAAADLTTPDLSAPDLAMPDLLPLITDSGMCSPGGATHAREVIDKLYVPMQRADYAMDLNGDGKADDQLGNVVGALTAQGFDIQASVDAQIAAGNDVMLLDAVSSDPMFSTDPCAATTFYTGANATAPDLSVVSGFTIDKAVPSTFFSGPLASKQFFSEPQPQQQVLPEQLHIKLPILALVPVTLWGAHLKWRYAGGGLIQGQINGAVTNSDMMNVVLPALASQLNAQVQANPSSSQSQQLLQIFDTGGQGCGGANDGMISTCEVASNAIIKNVLAPDVQLFQGGIYAPNPANTMKDSFSVGLGFTAVAASF